MLCFLIAEISSWRMDNANSPRS